MEDVDVSAQMWRSFTQWELGNNSSALRRKVGIMFIIAISFDLYCFVITIDRFQEEWYNWAYYRTTVLWKIYLYLKRVFVWKFLWIWFFICSVPPSDLLLRIGEHDLANEDEPYGYQERRVQIVASHPQFDPRTFEYDLALLRFYEPLLPFQPNVLPICLPDDDESYVGRTAYVTGWGRLYDGTNTFIL